MILSCPLQKETDYRVQQDHDRININVLITERFGTCYGAQCRFFDDFSEGV